MLNDVLTKVSLYLVSFYVLFNALMYLSVGLMSDIEKWIDITIFSGFLFVFTLFTLIFNIYSYFKYKKEELQKQIIISGISAIIFVLSFFIFMALTSVS